MSENNPVRQVRPRRIAAVAGSVLLACALIGGVGHTAVTVRDADRSAGRPTWQFPAADEDDAKNEANDKETKKPVSGLSAMLLPYGTDGYAPGPDLAEFGPDVEFSGAQATALRKQSLKELPRTTRRNVEKLVDEQHIKGMAMRSYAVRPERAGAEDTHDSVTVSVTLLRLESRSAVRRMSTSVNRAFSAADVFRESPEIEGHEGTRCYLTPKGDTGDLGAAFCTAAVGDVLVSATVDGPDPIDADLTAEFFAAQLDRIDDPGQAV